MNLLPDDFAPEGQEQNPRIGVSADGVRTSAGLEAQAVWAVTEGFAGVEIVATGEPVGVHAPAVPYEMRDRLRDIFAASSSFVAALAPYQETFDVTLVSPSAAIRRASVSELWSVCRFVGAVAPPGKGVVLVRTGVSPAGVGEGRQAQYLSECLTTLDRMAGEQNVQIGLLNRDWLTNLVRFASLAALDLKHTGIALDLGYALDSGQEMSSVIDFLLDPPLPLLHLRVPAAPWCVDAFAAPLADADFHGQLCLYSTDSEINNLIAARDLWQRALTLETPGVAEDGGGGGN